MISASFSYNFAIFSLLNSLKFKGKDFCIGDFDDRLIGLLINENYNN